MSILDSYQDQVARLSAACNLAFGEAPTTTTPPEDQAVIFPLGVVAHNLYKEVIFLVDAGLGFAALRSSRTLYECVIYSLYMSKHSETCKAYLETLNAHWAQVIRNLPGAEQSIPEVHKTLSAKVPAYAQGKKGIPLDWNDEKTTYNMAMDVGIPPEFHSLGFNYASAFVHPSPILLFCYFTNVPETNKFVLGNANQDKAMKDALQITHDLIINAIRLRLRYSDNGALRESLAECEKDFRDIWGYKPQLTA